MYIIWNNLSNTMLIKQITERLAYLQKLVYVVSHEVFKNTDSKKTTFSDLSNRLRNWTVSEIYSLKKKRKMSIVHTVGL